MAMEGVSDGRCFQRGSREWHYRFVGCFTGVDAAARLARTINTPTSETIETPPNVVPAQGSFHNAITKPTKTIRLAKMNANSIPRLANISSICC